ncbi:hypothetical protein [Halorubellus sp. PRR65]|uniref:hypothetical protein n=1 Tax=Halorubellus sp. PRR65 TaxID=3098148 RepID=UPI002B257EC0|nr:hypothetical protein [Halorubellus sp. PRR65]
MDDRDEATDIPKPETTKTLLDGIPARTLHDAFHETSPRPSIRDVIANHQHAQSRLHREAEALEFYPTQVYRVLERVQESYDAFEGAERRPIVDHGNRYVAFGLNGADWYTLFDFIRRNINDEEQREDIARAATKVMSDITDENWHSHNSLPLVVSQARVRDVLAYHEEAYDGRRP